MAVLGLFLCCGIPGLIVSSLLRTYRNTKETFQSPLCISNLKSLAAAQAMYSVDDMGRLPGANWMDATLPYLKENVGALGCPSARNKAKDEYGFAMNEQLIGKLLTEAMALKEAPLIFDSTLLKRNAIGPVSTMPSPGRHRLDQGGEANLVRDNNNVVFADGNTKTSEHRY